MSERLEIDPNKICILIYNNGKSTWEDKTKQITAMYEAFMYGKFTGYHIYFRGGEIKYFYSQDRVRILSHLKTISLDDVEVIVDNTVVDATRVELFENEYYRVYDGNSYILTKQIRFESNKHNKIYQYYDELADKGLQIAEADSPLFYLSKNFKRISPNQNSCLLQYLKGHYHKNDKQHRFILPFSFNQSQRVAIEKALGNNISVIEGPPGTGKTQTILNLIANIVANGYTCAVVSNNNNAIQNVYDKLHEDKFAFFVAALGNRERTQTFFSSVDESDLNTFLNNEFEPLKYNVSKRVDFLINTLYQVHEAENEAAKKRVELTELEKEIEHIRIDVPDGYQIKPGLKSKEYLRLKIKLESGKPLGLFARLWVSIKYKTLVRRENNAMLLGAAERLFYIAKTHEIKKKIEEKEKFLV